MPTYEYVCTDCGQDLEVVQSFSDAALTECPQCSGKLRKRYSPVGVVFKGSGFYKTDSRQKVRKGSDEPAKPTAVGAGDGEAAGGPARSDAVAARGAGGASDKSTGGADKGTDGARSGQKPAGGAAKGSGGTGGTDGARSGQKAAGGGRSGSDSGSGKGSREASSSAA